MSAIQKTAEKELDVTSEDITYDIEISLAKNEQLHTASVNISPKNIEINNKPIYDNWLWNIKQVTNNYESHSINKGTHNVRVGVIDSGIDYSHPDLKNNIVDVGDSFVPGDDSTQDFYGHGTSIAGIIAANGNIIGVGPELGLVPYKVFDVNGSGKASWVINAIVEAVNDDMDVINLSLTTFLSKQDKEDREIIKAFEKAFNFAKKHNTLIVAASGNYGYDISNPKMLAQQLGKPNDKIIQMPGGDNDVVTVSATTAENSLAFYSNYGKNISIAAPGGDLGPNFIENNEIDISSMILTTHPTNLPQSQISQALGFEKGYDLSLGTSLATPKVTATAALLKAEYYEKYGEEMPNHKVKKNLYKNADKNVGLKKNQVGGGIVNTYKSLLNVER